MRRFTGIAVAVLAAAGLTAGTPSAQAKPASLYAPSVLVLTTSHGEGQDADVDRAVTLSCAPRSEGTHPAPDSACAELRQAAGVLNALLVPSDGRLCVQAYAPITLTADGVWKGQRVSWQRTFANSCEKEAVAGGTFFAF
ncbi:subtilase-type protease inhibitor [Streptomyces sp. 1222.5]|uniref:subtilase-type protease inhibitor n=1 Tax=Streptomyces sp. 1222.5 TaxID=1881026 RepID=UPI003EB8B7F4